MDTVMYHAELMLKRRGYAVTRTTTDVTDKGIESVKLIGENDAGETVVAYFVRNFKVTIDAIKAIILASSVKRIMIVYEKSLTPDAKHAVLINKIFNFETFSFDEMSYDPIAIVPKHYALNYKPKEWKKFPVILTTDAVAKYYAFKRNDVIAVEEDDRTLSFRKCV